MNIYCSDPKICSISFIMSLNEEFDFEKSSIFKKEDFKNRQNIIGKI